MESQDIEILREKAEKQLTEAKSLEELEQGYKKYLGKKGELTLILRKLVNLSLEERQEKGEEANNLRDLLMKLFQKRSKELRSTSVQNETKEEFVDITAPGKKIEKGHLHPLTQVQRKALEIFQGMGFSVVQGPEIETEWYNFDALNIPPNHPARDMWDTFGFAKTKSKIKTKKEKVAVRS